MATTNGTSSGPFLFIGGCSDGEWQCCTEPRVLMPVRDSVIGNDGLMEMECNEYKKFGIRIYSGGAIHFVYLSSDLAPDDAIQMLMRGYRGKENQ